MQRDVAERLLLSNEETSLRAHHRQIDGFILIICLLAGVDAFAPEQVILGPQKVSGGHQSLSFKPEGLTGKAHKHQDDAKVDNVSSVAPCVPHGQIVDGSEEVFLARLHSRARALIKLPNDACRHEGTQEQGHPRVEAMHAHVKENASNNGCKDQRHREIALDALEGGFSPGKQRPGAGKKQQQQPDGDHHLVEERWAHCDRNVLNGF